MGEQRRILIVDDDESVRRVLSAMLGRTGEFDLIEADCGKSGVMMALKEKPDMMILDVVMPDMNGLEVLKSIKDDPRTCHIAVLMLTGNIDDETMTEAMQSRADVFMNKPVQKRILLEKVAGVMAARGMI